MKTRTLLTYGGVAIGLYLLYNNFRKNKNKSTSDEERVAPPTPIDASPKTPIDVPPIPDGYPVFVKPEKDKPLLDKIKDIGKDVVKVLPNPKPKKKIQVPKLVPSKGETPEEKKSLVERLKEEKAKRLAEQMARLEAENQKKILEEQKRLANLRKVEEERKRQLELDVQRRLLDAKLRAEQRAREEQLAKERLEEERQRFLEEEERFRRRPPAKPVTYPNFDNNVPAFPVRLKDVPVFRGVNI